MDSVKLAQVCSKAINYLGKETQIRKCIEELSELREELSESIDCRDMDRIHDELADVMIMLVQMQLIFDFDKIGERVKLKRDRLKSMIDMSTRIEQEFYSKYQTQFTPERFRKMLWRKGVGPMELSLVRYFEECAPEVRVSEFIKNVLHVYLGPPRS